MEGEQKRKAEQDGGTQQIKRVEHARQINARHPLPARTKMDDSAVLRAVDDVLRIIRVISNNSGFQNIFNSIVFIPLGSLPERWWSHSKSYSGKRLIKLAIAILHQ